MGARLELLQSDGYLDTIWGLFCIKVDVGNSHVADELFLISLTYLVDLLDARQVLRYRYIYGEVETAR